MTIKRPRDGSRSFENKKAKIDTWQSFFGFQNNIKIFEPKKSAWYYLHNKTKVKIIESHHDENMDGVEFYSVEDAALALGCCYHHIHLAVKYDLYIRGQFKLRYII